MNLLGQDKDMDMEPIAEAASGGFVLNFEGDPADLIKTEEPVQDLRGATRTLPGREEIREAVEAAAEQAEDAVETAEAAVVEAKEAVEEAEPAVEPAEPAAKPAKPEAPKPVIPAASPIPEAVIPPASRDPKAAPAPEEPSEQDREPEAPEEPKEEKLSSVSYASVAQAVVNAKKEPTGRYDRDAIDDETLLAELYALIGDSKPKKAAEPAAKEAAAAPAPAPARPAPAPRPVVRITPDALKDAPEEYVEIEEDTTGAPGWLKGIFILLISLLLSAMTFYAVASDVIGEIF